jgi:pyruvate dehydrogenase E1 component
VSPVPSAVPGPAATEADPDPEETGEWLDSWRALTASGGRERAGFVLDRLLEQARRDGIDRDGAAGGGRGSAGAGTPVDLPLVTDFVNTIPVADQPPYPGDPELELRITNAVKWNAAVLVSRANRPGIGVGGHIATFAGAATLYEVGHQHFFHGPDAPGGADQVFFQGHASPGMYARAFVEGRLPGSRLDGFRQELTHAGGGLPSYPHPRLMPDFWQFPTVSMGLGPINSIYQARFNRYLDARGFSDTSAQRVWAFLGDGEMDEVESLGAIGLAAREQLDNLVWVINCNLQRLDGPVRGNGKVMQELESHFRGAGWRVIKVVWGSDWDPLLDSPARDELITVLNSVPDGQMQTWSVEPGSVLREELFGRDPALVELASRFTDTELRNLSRGGHDPVKVHAAYDLATRPDGRPTVVLAHTVKGWQLETFAGRNATHQMKKLTGTDARGFRDILDIPITDAELDADHYRPPYYRPSADSPEGRYLAERLTALGGSLPRRVVAPVRVTLPPENAYAQLLKGSGKQQVATTMAFVRLLKDLMRDKGFGRRIVPIIPDEARTFGLDATFATAKIYSPSGQNYTPVDSRLLLSYRESTSGQILHEGINEAGAMGSFVAAASSYATHGQPMVPVYLFYSMFGFQRTGDAMWALGDQLGRGFLVGATAGRTTLNGEGLQHEDGHSPLLASTNPACVSYDPAFGFEVSHIVRDGLARMYGPTEAHPHGENVFYYLTLYNEPISQPAQPADVDVEALLRGLYRYQAGPASLNGEPPPKAQLLASGSAMPWALEAQERLASEWGVSVDVWSATSWTQLRREALECDRIALDDPDGTAPVPHVTRVLSGAPGPVIAVSDYMRAVPDQIAPWVPADWTSLGTDGWGRSDTRAALRRHFRVDAQSIVVATLAELARRGEVKRETVVRARDAYALHDVTATTAEEAGGDS